MRFFDRFRDYPIQRKLTVLMLLASAAGLGLAGGSLIGYNWSGARTVAQQNLESVATIVADNAGAALLFNDAATAGDTLSTLGDKPGIVQACLYGLRTEGAPQLFAAYAGTSAQQCTEYIDASAPDVPDTSHLSVVVPVMLKGEHLGWLRLSQTLEPLQEALRVQIGITLAIIATSFGISFLIAWGVQGLISRPVLRLAETARRVSESRNYGLRAPAAQGRDEVGQLIQDFNQMLEQIHQRDQDLQFARDTSARVAEEKTRANRELEQTLHRLKETQELVRATVESAVDGIIVIDSQGIIQAFNPAAERMFGYSAEEAIGRNLKFLMPPPYSGEHDQYLRNYLTTGVKKIIGKGREVTGQRKDGSIFPLDLAVSEMSIGRERRFAGIVRDITLRMQQEEELHRLNESLARQVTETGKALQRLKEAQTQLVQNEKLASLGALVAGIAHEINTPVGVGVTAASTLQSGAAELKKHYAADTLRRSDLERFVKLADESSQIILRNLQRAADLIHSFKQVAVDQSSGEQRSFELKSYVEEILISLGPKLRQTNHTITVEGPQAIPVESYPGALAQILTNLVSNSLLHAYKPGQAGKIRIVLQHEDSWVTLRFSDDGCGISRENQHRIFDPFFTTKRGSGGSGLGMHIVYNLVTQILGGTIAVHSEPGRGTEFVVRFPVQLRQAAA